MAHMNHRYTCRLVYTLYGIFIRVWPVCDLDDIWSDRDGACKPIRVWVIWIDTNIEVIAVSSTTREAHHSPRAKPEGCGELPRSLMRHQWPNLRYQFLFYHDETKLMINKYCQFKCSKISPNCPLVTARLHVHILGSGDLIVSPW